MARPALNTVRATGTTLPKVSQLPTQPSLLAQAHFAARKKARTRAGFWLPTRPLPTSIASTCVARDQEDCRRTQPVRSDSAICLEYGSDNTPLMRFLNDRDETPGPTRYLVIRNADTSFVYFSAQDGVFPPAPAEVMPQAANLALAKPAGGIMN